MSVNGAKRKIPRTTTDLVVPSMTSCFVIARDISPDTAEDRHLSCAVLDSSRRLQLYAHGSRHMSASRLNEGIHAPAASSEFFHCGSCPERYPPGPPAHAPGQLDGRKFAERQTPFAPCPVEHRSFHPRRRHAGSGPSLRRVTFSPVFRYDGLDKTRSEIKRHDHPPNTTWLGS